MKKISDRINKYDAKSLEEWPSYIDKKAIKKIESIVSWRTKHQKNWYLTPGRSLYLSIGDNLKCKIKGAGFYNPSDISFSGIKRTISYVPSDDKPMPPLQEKFERDIIHIDPSNKRPFLFSSVKSNFAPIGGMVLDAAKNDQLIFKRLLDANLPTNKPIALYQYENLFLESKKMGVSISQVPNDALLISPYDIYLHWYKSVNINLTPSPSSLESRIWNTLESPDKRLELISKLGKKAGTLLYDFSVKANLYRFSGSPDNWSIKDSKNPSLFFSDVDTCMFMDQIDSHKKVWELCRNLISTLHQWIYFFLPPLSYSKSGYNVIMLKKHDFIKNILEGFFKDDKITKECSDKIWDLIEPVYIEASKQYEIPLRSGEAFLQNYINRPSFYIIILYLLRDLIISSNIGNIFINRKLLIDDLDSYIFKSLKASSHKTLFKDYSIKETLRTLKKYS